MAHPIACSWPGPHPAGNGRPCGLWSAAARDAKTPLSGATTRPGPSILPSSWLWANRGFSGPQLDVPLPLQTLGLPAPTHPLDSGTSFRTPQRCRAVHAREPSQPGGVPCPGPLSGPTCKPVTPPVQGVTRTRKGTKVHGGGGCQWGREPIFAIRCQLHASALAGRDARDQRERMDGTAWQEPHSPRFRRIGGMDSGLAGGAGRAMLGG